MITANVNLIIVEGRLYLPVQSDVEDIALRIVDDRHRIYFDPIPLTDKLYLKYDRKPGYGYGWEVLAKEE